MIFAAVSGGPGAGKLLGRVPGSLGVIFQVLGEYSVSRSGEGQGGREGPPQCQGEPQARVVAQDRRQFRQQWRVLCFCRTAAVSHSAPAVLLAQPLALHLDGLCCPVGSAFPQPLLSCGLCWPGDSATWCLSLLFMRSAVRPPGFKPWRSCFLAGWPWATD